MPQMDALKTTLHFVTHELRVFLTFSWRDWSASLIPGSTFGLAAMRSSHLPPSSFISNWVFLVSWLTVYIYFFNLSNQITGVEEDRLNKPDRPIPSGMVSLEGAKLRWALIVVAYLVMGVCNPIVLPETVAWIGTTAFLSLTSAGNHWFGKNNIAMFAGSWSLLRASWKAMTPLTPSCSRNILSLGAWAGIGVHIQDLRDVKGDAMLGRKTMPLVFGDRTTRRAIAFVFLPVALGVLGISDVFAIAPTTLTAMHFFLGYRVIQERGARYDHKTYMLLTYLFCFLMALVAAQGLEIPLLNLETLGGFLRQGHSHQRSS